METSHCNDCNDALYEFKSYYVVWKPTASALCWCETFGFKSYYVVWKLIFSDIRRDRRCEFKSYYVVWKQGACFLSVVIHGSLNRTMQYGNGHGHDIMHITLTSLNRTMQYGNLFLVTFFYKKSNRLNRTMQYGNALPKTCLPAQYSV